MRAMLEDRNARAGIADVIVDLKDREAAPLEVRTDYEGNLEGGGGVKRRKFRWKKKHCHKGTNHEPNNLKLQTNKKQKTSNNKHEQPTLKLDKSQMTKTQKQEQARASLWRVLPPLLENI